MALSRADKTYTDTRLGGLAHLNSTRPLPGLSTLATFLRAWGGAEKAGKRAGQLGTRRDEQDTKQDTQAEPLVALGWWVRRNRRGGMSQIDTPPNHPCTHPYNAAVQTKTAPLRTPHTTHSATHLSHPVWCNS